MRTQCSLAQLLALINLFLTVANAATAALLSVNLPVSISSCEVVPLSWNGGTGPYLVASVPAADPSGEIFEVIGTFTTLNHIWTVDLPAGTQLYIGVKDSTGTITYAGP